MLSIKHHNLALALMYGYSICERNASAGYHLVFNARGRLLSHKKVLLLRVMAGVTECMELMVTDVIHR